MRSFDCLFLHLGSFVEKQLGGCRVVRSSIRLGRKNLVRGGGRGASTEPEIVLSLPISHSLAVSNPHGEESRSAQLLMRDLLRILLVFLSLSQSLTLCFVGTLNVAWISAFRAASMPTK